MRKQEKWHKIGERKNIVTFFELVSLGLYDRNCRAVLGFPLGINAFRNYGYEIGFKEREFKRGVSVIKKELARRGPKYFLDLADQLDKKGHQLVDYCHQLGPKFPADINRLRRLIIGIRTKARVYSPALVLANAIEPTIEKKLRSVISDRVKDKKLRESFFQTLSTAEEIDETEAELEAVRKIQQWIKAKKVKSSSTALKTRVDQHIKKWGWVIEGRQGKQQNLQQSLINRLRKKIEKHSIMEKKKDVFLRSEKIIKQYKIDPSYVRLMKKYVYFRTHRMNLFLQASYHLYPLLKHLGRIIGREPRLVQHMTFDEIIDALSGKALSREVLRGRLDTHYINILSENGKVTVSMINKTVKQAKKVALLKGQIAHMGMAQGTVKIVRELSDISKVRVGDILVASMTIPEYVPAMEKAAAFVTNEGGILCHAAIVAREMKKPCIIGTKNATEVFRDNDLVSVNGNKGIVKLVI